MVTWDEIIEDADSEIGVMTETANVTTALKLYFASKAQFKLHKQSGSARRRRCIDLSKFDSNGRTSLNDDISVISFGELVLTGGKKYKIYPTTYEEIVNAKKYVENGGTIEPGQVYLAQEFNKLYAYPVQELTGELQINYVPLLLPYTEARAEKAGSDWYGCIDDDFQDFIESHGLEPEYEDEVDGIQAYLCYQICRRHPMAKTMMADEIREWRGMWHEAVRNVESGSVNHSMNAPAPSYGGPIT
jgi:hypothetical protein